MKKILLVMALMASLVLGSALPGLAAVGPAQYDLEQRILQYDRESLTMVEEVLENKGFLFFPGSTEDLGWSVWQGQAAYLNDEEFLKIVGDDELYNKVVTYKRRVRIASTGLMGLGAGAVLLSGATETGEMNSTMAGAGLVSILAGMAVNKFWGGENRWLSAEDAAQRVEDYNQRLLQELSLTPADVAY